MLVGIPPFYDDNMKVLYDNINRGKLKLPKYLSNEAKKLLQKILNKDPKKRPSIDQLISDPFFEEIDWDLLLKKELSPPTVLCRSDRETSQTAKVAHGGANEEDEMFFEKDDKNSNGDRPVFVDEDYNDNNRHYQRVKNYSFVRT
mmetsp:Transcript_30292/g.46305  ORF Transcript_30292/g.46305 Transcript_30292/m.46305 type:complete len:145 (-) Transcript_30292:26-460(-)